eukprot:gene46622-63154_t
MAALIGACTCTTAVFAQDSTTKTHKAMKGKMMKDGVKMKEGKLWVIKNGEKSELAQDLTLDDGTVVMADGTVKMKDGMSKTMSDGDFVGMDGKWTKKMDKMRKMEKAKKD